MTDIILRDDLTVCSDCAMVLANGTDGWGLDDNGQELGEAHAARMLPGDFVLSGEEGEEAWFAHTPCDACGDALAGDRLAAVEFGKPMPGEMFRAYLECALWSSTDDDGEPLDREHGTDSIDAATRAEMLSDCRDFWAANYADLGTMEPGQAGHDFWLTRNGHGAGFWDRGLGELGERLTRATKVYGGVELYIGDDGLIYVS